MTPAKGEVSGAHKAALKSAVKDYLSRNPGKGVKEAHADRYGGPVNQESQAPPEKGAKTAITRSFAQPTSRPWVATVWAEWRPLCWNQVLVGSSQGHAP